MKVTKFLPRFCEVCKKEFTPTRRAKAKTCSLKCCKKLEYFTHRQRYYEQSKKKRLKNPEAVRAYAAAWREKHREDVRRKHHAWRLKKITQVRENARKSYHARKERVAKYLVRVAGTEYGKQKHRAQQSVYLAVKKGILSRPSLCSQCGTSCKPDAHHHKGYVHRLDIQWLCRLCHGREHSLDG